MSTKLGNCDGCFADCAKVATIGNASICKQCLVSLGKSFGAKPPSTSDRDALLSENVALRKDAERYRAIRNQLNGVGGWVLSIFAENCEGAGEILIADKADEAIDAAR